MHPPLVKGNSHPELRFALQGGKLIKSHCYPQQANKPKLFYTRSINRKALNMKQEVVSRTQFNMILINLTKVRDRHLNLASGILVS